MFFSLSRFTKGHFVFNMYGGDGDGGDGGSDGGGFPPP